MRYIEICLLEFMDLESLLRFGKTPDRRRGKKRVTAAQFRKFANRHNAGKK